MPCSLDLSTYLLYIHFYVKITCNRDIILESVLLFVGGVVEKNTSLSMLEGIKNCLK